MGHREPGGWFLIRALVALDVWLEPLSMIRRMRSPGTMCWSSMPMNLMKVTESLRRIRWLTTSPVETFIAATMETVPWRRYSHSRRASRPGPGGKVRVPSGLGLDAGLLIDADQHGAGVGVQVEAADRAGLCPERGVVGAVEPAADHVLADLRLRQDAGDDTDEEIPLCRIEYLGGDDWAFALYDPATEDYEESTLRNGQYTGTAVDAYDTAAIVHLIDYVK